jgi:hypothetical protein
MTLLRHFYAEQPHRGCGGAPLRPLHIYEDAEALLLRVALLFRLDEPLPDFLVDRIGLVDFRGAIEARDAARGNRPDSRSGGLRKKMVTLLPFARLALVDPRPRSHNAKCSSSNTMVLPRGVI